MIRSLDQALCKAALWKHETNRHAEHGCRHPGIRQLGAANNTQMTKGVSIGINWEDCHTTYPVLKILQMEELISECFRLERNEITPVDTPSTSCSNMMFVLKVRHLWGPVL